MISNSCQIKCWSRINIQLHDDVGSWVHMSVVWILVAHSVNDRGHLNCSLFRFWHVLMIIVQFLLIAFKCTRSALGTSTSVYFLWTSLEDFYGGWLVIVRTMMVVVVAESVAIIARMTNMMCSNSCPDGMMVQWQWLEVSAAAWRAMAYARRTYFDKNRLVSL